ncbi:MAG: hypothetical protein VX794_00400 [Nitrospinota bacterium]|nr:hypothetical protein [Nitrospinota bacterium]
MSDEHTYILDVGDKGRIYLSKEIMKKLGIVSGHKIKIQITNQIASMSRHQIKDPFLEAKNKKKIEFSDLFEKQKIQKEQANKTFEERVKEKHTFREEDKKDFWD